MICGVIDLMRTQGHGVKLICKVLTDQNCQVTPRPYRAWKRAEPTGRDWADAIIVDALLATGGTPKGMYERHKMTALLRRQGHEARDLVDRLMRQQRMAGRVRGKGVKATIQDRIDPRRQPLPRRPTARD